MSTEGTELAGVRVTENILRGPDGVYRWYYEMRLMRNPTILFTVWKVLGVAIGAVLGVVLLVDLAEGSLRYAWAWQGFLKLLLIMIVIFLALSVVSYLILAALYGWKYLVLFEMTDDYVKHIQLPKQVQKAEAVGWLTALVGLAAGKPGVTGTGMLAASKSTSTSEFKNVRTVKIRRRRDTIHVNQLLDRNQVYASGADFDFVEQFIRARCVNAKIK